VSLDILFEMREHIKKGEPPSNTANTVLTAIFESGNGNAKNCTPISVKKVSVIKLCIIVVSNFGSTYSWNGNWMVQMNPGQAQ